MRQANNITTNTRRKVMTEQTKKWEKLKEEIRQTEPTKKWEKIKEEIRHKIYCLWEEVAEVECFEPTTKEELTTQLLKAEEAAKNLVPKIIIPTHHEEQIIAADKLCATGIQATVIIGRFRGQCTNTEWVVEDMELSWESPEWKGKKLMSIIKQALVETQTTNLEYVNTTKCEENS
jgi:hypothetical protein